MNRSERNHDYYLKHKEDLLAKHKKWARDNREKQNSYTKKWHWNLKKSALEHYGGAICKICGETDLSLLQLDHVNNDGGQHRRELFGEHANEHGSVFLSAHFYRYLRKNNYPDTPALQVLCRKCNQEKERKYMEKQQAINGLAVWTGYEGVLDEPARAFYVRRGKTEDNEVKHGIDIDK